jgi:hypothetical protein
LYYYDYRVDPVDEEKIPECSEFFGPDEGDWFHLRAIRMDSLSGKLVRIDPMTGNNKLYLY